ncbi:cytochrome c oxidase accessory protein CcoG [Sediminibacterium soli]|uniref:cytochrome c oxidase accessory protein CcoG n=1 Tax=Sediminibacterium soli TaxID=2698829 RepID=UPI00137AFA41|nr:cytochrome c oxidase accessory protein CcoG [Sediminibacterium soli]NCI45682.1 cytochrome c oxidase accessory protein CcoG [Sediminibacterium soli]
MATGNQSKESFRDSLATLDESGKRKWVYAVQPKGKLYRIRTYVSYAYFLLFFGLPFVEVNGRPLFLFNIPEAKFTLFGKVFWPQDFFIFGLAMVTFIFFIVLFTAAFGRLFCGWVCPQTIFMEMLFRRVEFLVLGSANKQKMLKQQPWTTKKIVLVTTKHVLFFLLAFIIANFFLAYVIGIRQLEKIITEPLSGHLIGFSSIIIFSAVFYSVYAFFREQACTVACPYGRLQSVLLDKNSMVVAYDYTRGEPRGHSKQATAGFGDCIDCFQCVRVCPTGIDIRNGVQMECVGCTACIDACDDVMIKINKPTKLIRYASENGIAKGEKLHYTTRMKLYTGLCVLMLGILSVLLMTRKDIDATIMRTPGILFQERGTDSVSNLYNIKVVNKTVKDVPLSIRMENTAGDVRIIGKDYIPVAKEGQGSGTFFVVLPKSSIKTRKTAIELGLYDRNKKIATIKTNFLGPVG